MSMFEAERLRILERISNGELSPQEGNLEIAMLKVRYQQAAEQIAPDDETTTVEIGAAPRQDRRAEDDFAQRFEETLRQRMAEAGRPFGLKRAWPLLVLLAIPVLSVVALVVGGIGLVLALPTWLAVTIWNATSATQLAFWPTLGCVIAAFVVFSLARGWWRMRAYFR